MCLFNKDSRVAALWMKKFLEGSITFLEIPVWVLAKKRCVGVNKRGRCTQAVLTPDRDLCFYCQQQKHGYLMSVDDDPALKYLLEDADEGD